MYPLDHFRLFPAYPVTKRVFVAMDFSPTYDARWLNVIRPGIQAVRFNGERLDAHRVDTSRVSVAVASQIGLRVFGNVTPEMREAIRREAEAAENAPEPGEGEASTRGLFE